MKAQSEYTRSWLLFLSEDTAENTARSILDCCRAMTQNEEPLTERQVGALHTLLLMLDTAHGAASRYAYEQRKKLDAA